MSRAWVSALRVVFGLLGAGFIGLAFTTSWGETQVQLPSIPTLGLGWVAAATGLACAATGWTTLLEPSGSRRIAKYDFFLSQLGKYIPGGIWQFAGQIGLATSSGASLTHATSALSAHVVVQIAAGGTVALAAGLTVPSMPIAWRLCALASGGFVLLLHRSVMLTLVRRIRALGRPIDWPSQGALLKSYGWSIATLACSATAFSMLLFSLEAAGSRTTAGLVFGVAWLAGFLAFLVPAGVGVREAVMMACLPASAGAVAAASIAHRLLVIAAESLWIIVARLQLR